MTKQTLVLVDGSYYLFRAYHAMPAFTNSAGEPTGAIYGVINMIHKLLQDYQPDYFAVVFDAKGKNFRNDWYPEYKAHRPPTPEDLTCQIEPLHEIIRAEGFPLLIVNNVEADDVIATLAREAERNNIKTIISTGDKDLAQIVNHDIHLINTMTNTLLDPPAVLEKYGVPPEQIIDYLTLVGDSADNVPGVPKVGPKTAAKWLHEYGSLDEVIRNADKIGGKIGETLRDSIAILPLSKKLVTLVSDLALDISIKDLRKSEPDIEALAICFKRWEFKSWLAQLPTHSVSTAIKSHPDQSALTNYETILTSESLDRWLGLLEQADLFAFDTETTSLDYMEAEIVGLSFAVEPHQAAYVPLAHSYPGAPDQLSRDKVLAQLKPLLTSATARKLGHNLKYDKNVLANYDIPLLGIAHDSMLESYVLDSTASRHDMDSLARRYLDYTTIHYEDVAGKGAKQIRFDQVAIDKAATYAAEDADITLRLHQQLWPKLSSQPGLKSLYEQVEIPLLEILSCMERTGVLIDAEMLKHQSIELTERMATIETAAQDLAGEKFNIASPKQIQSILYEKMGLPVLEKTPTGQPSTAESVLQELAHEHDLAKLILEHRGLSKLKSTYTDKLPEQINRRSGRVHTSYHQAVASTGRLSSSDPNLQNIPIRSVEGRKIRQAFIAPPGYVLLAADYSQIELRIMAHLSADPTLLESFSRNEDIHRTTAAEIFNLPVTEVTTDQRRAAKAINFGLIYGMSAFGLARQLGIDRNQAKQYVERYFERYPAVKDYMDMTRKKARQEGYVETVFKRRLYLPEISSRNAARRQYAERTAINAPMQGTAADIIKRAMIEIDRQILRYSGSIRMVMQVHDELVFEIEEPSVDTLSAQIRKIMTAVPELSVPVIVDIGTGSNWDEAH
jgi:DNA polymerase-1